MPQGKGASGSAMRLTSAALKLQCSSCGPRFLKKITLTTAPPGGMTTLQPRRTAGGFIPHFARLHLRQQRGAGRLYVLRHISGVGGDELVHAVLLHLLQMVRREKILEVDELSATHVDVEVFDVRAWVNAPSSCM